MSVSPIKCESIYDGAVERITLNFGGNIFNKATIEALQGEIRSLDKRDDLKAVVITSAGDDFSVATPVEEQMPGKIEKTMPIFNALFRRIEALGVPTAAVVKGRCEGGGFELATSCGWLFCDRSATFSVPGTIHGVFPPVASVLLPWRIGGARATQIIVTGRTVYADEAERIGLVDKVREDPDGEVDVWLKKEILPKSSVALRFAWKNCRRDVQRSLIDRLMEVQTSYLGELMAYKDPVEGLTAFVEDRDPNWENQ